MCIVGGIIALIILQTVPITSYVPYFEIPSSINCNGEFLLGAEVGEHFPEDYYTFQQDIDKCPSD